jgi:hypothetical protein
MALYRLSVDGIALGAGVAKSILELATAASDRAKIVEWGLTFDGVTAANTPVKCEMGRFSAAVTTATTLAGGKLDAGDGGQSATTKHTTTVEGAGTIDADAMILRVPPTQGFVYQAPLGREEVVPVSSFWRMRLTAAQAVNASFWLVWDE